MRWPILWQQACKKAGVEVDMIEGFKTKELVILEDEFRAGVDRSLRGDRRWFLRRKSLYDR